MHKYIVLCLLAMHSSLYSWPQEKVLIQGINHYWDEVDLKSVYQIGSQAYLEIEFIDDPETAHIGWPVALSKELNLPLPSFVCMLTTEPPGVSSRVLFEDGKWVDEYEIDVSNPTVLTYDMEGYWDVSHYPWVYSNTYGYFYIYPISDVLRKDPLASYYCRWVHGQNFGWAYKLPAYYPRAIPFHQMPLGTVPLSPMDLP